VGDWNETLIVPATSGGMMAFQVHPMWTFFERRHIL
jgi:hypothetical protein